jgi:phosphopantothenoylcysteine synthetase/decarboxylase
VREGKPLAPEPVRQLFIRHSVSFEGKGLHMRDKTIVLAVSGGIAAYKSAYLVREFIGAGADVHVVMTEHACRFVTPLTFQTLSRNQVAVDQFAGENQWDMEHIALADRADLLVVAPATANIIGKAAAAIADDLVSTAIVTMLGSVPIIMAPAMNSRMWKNPLVQHNVATLETAGVQFVGPIEGPLAEGRSGVGRMAEVPEIVRAAAALLAR